MTWYSLRRMNPTEEDPPYGMQLGRWYEDTRLPVEEGHAVTVFLNIDGTETSVPRLELQFSDTKPEYSFNYHLGGQSIVTPGEKIPTMEWTPICPEGHRGEPKHPAAAEHACGECGRTYRVQDKDSAIVQLG